MGVFTHKRLINQERMRSTGGFVVSGPRVSPSGPGPLRDALSAVLQRAAGRGEIPRGSIETKARLLNTAVVGLLASASFPRDDAELAADVAALREMVTSWRG